ncbi:proton-coupled folate transporter-like [Topomyia yanbarensis]|uniref:proton-coupled folate transporter-like n=1 Tax=Topomyia yanbarensis TaxID=2498891 RepID=UPI00273CA989|nr:proton-coupled folate transporter-like [Topomyia yanbarensis]
MKIANKNKEQSPLLAQSNPRSCSWNVLQCITIEPVVLLHTFGWSISEVMLINQIIFQSCVVTLDSNICANLGTDDVGVYLEEIVQPLASAISMTIAVLTSVVPALIALFFAPWSDKFGRKGIIAAASIGYLITDLMVALVSYLSSYYIVSPWFYVVANIPVAVLGGFSVFYVGVYSFLHDVTNEQNRTIRMGILHGCSLFGILSGLLVSSRLSMVISLTVMFIISATTALISIVYLVFVIQESVLVDQSYTTIEKLKAAFNISYVRTMLNTFTKSRPKYERSITWLLIAIGGLVEFAIAGRVLFFLYTRHEFRWNTTTYSLWLAAEMGTMILGNILGIAMLKRMFNISDIGILTISTINHLADYLLKGISTQGWQLYLTTILTPFKGVDGAAIRALLSNILPAEDIGQIYAMDLCIKAFIPLIAAFSLTYVYNSTIDTAPSTYLFVTGATFVLNLLFIGVAHILLKLRERHSSLERREFDSNYYVHQ